ncbi:rhodanese-like domain-containing protein [Nocardioides sp. NPDC051685]|uniref:rhodanese-like domain-containing protein n=1 Tax=Nocardioides sp. NPDC051685 TaxID=3364334 RepID=UPI003793D097
MGAGAISIPTTELRSRLAELPDGTAVVAYCRGPYCVYADDVVRTLQAAGREAVRLEDGYPEWAAYRLPIAALRK